MNLTGVVVFALTYLMISARRLGWLGLDRPAAALAGAVACVALKVLSPAEALAAIDLATLLLLFGVMGMGANLAADGFFEEVAGMLVARARTPARLLGLIVWSAGLLSAFITNDAVCVLGAPLVVGLIRQHRLPPLPFLLALAMGANTGSVATLVGNPQNMLCGLLGELSFRTYLLHLFPVALAGLAIQHALLRFLFRVPLRAAVLAPTVTSGRLSRRSWITTSVIAGCAVIYCLGGHLAWTAAMGFVVLLFLQRRDPRLLWARIDGSVLLFFAGLFVVVEGFRQSGAPDRLFELFPLAAGEDGLTGWLRLSGIFLVGSNVVSNVPFILVVREQMATLSDPQLGWEILAMASTFAGNLTLLGSVANIIVAEAGRDVGGIRFLAYLRVGVPLTLLTTLIGTLWIVFVAG